MSCGLSSVFVLSSETVFIYLVTVILFFAGFVILFVFFFFFLRGGVIALYSSQEL